MTISILAKSVSYLEYSMDHYLVKTFSNLMVPTRMVRTSEAVRWADKVKNHLFF